MRTNHIILLATILTTWIIPNAVWAQMSVIEPSITLSIGGDDYNPCNNLNIEKKYSEYQVNWQSSNEDIVSVGDYVGSQYDKLFLRKKGTVTLTASLVPTDGDLAIATATFEVVVKGQAATLSFGRMNSQQLWENVTEEETFYGVDYEPPTLRFNGYELNDTTRYFITYSKEGIIYYPETDRWDNGKIIYGMPNIVGVGTVTVTATFPGNDQNEAASAQYTLTVFKKYDLWIGDTQVTDKNCSDILSNGDATQGKVASFQYIPNLNKLFITNHTDWVRIVTNDDEGLTIYLAPNSDNTIGEIIYGGKRDAPLTITTDGNYPGTITLSANNNVISGFSSLTLEQNLVITTDPEDITYDTRNRVLETTHATIGVPLSPITKEKTIIPNGTELQPKPGSDYINKVVGDILYTLGHVNSSDGDGYDDDGFIVINSVTTDQQVADAVQNYIPGTEEYLERFKGLTFMIPAGKGKIIFDVQTLNGYAMKVMVGDAVPVIVENAETGTVEIPYNVAEPTYVYVWNAGKSCDVNNARSIHKGKMTTVHIKITGVGVQPNQVKSSNSAAEASGGEYNGDVSGLEGQELETLEEIEASKGDVNGDETSNVADIIGIVNAIRGEHSTTFDRRAADVDDNNVINADDIVRLVEKMMGQ
jgi:hypothetical protein